MILLNARGSGDNWITLVRARGFPLFRLCFASSPRLRNVYFFDREGAAPSMKILIKNRHNYATAIGHRCVALDFVDVCAISFRTMLSTLRGQLPRTGGGGGGMKYVKHKLIAR